MFAALGAFASPAADAQTRRAIDQFARCVVEKHHREAARLVLSLGVNHATAQAISDGDCANFSMVVWPATLQAALADALVNDEFPTFSAALIDGAPPLEQPVLNETSFAPKPGKTYRPEELRKLEQTKDILRAGIAFTQFGECVVRADPADSHALLMTEVASVEEAVAIQRLRSVFAKCPSPNGRVDDPADFRGTIAKNFYRLVHCGRDTVAVDCNPNKSVPRK